MARGVADDGSQRRYRYAKEVDPEDPRWRMPEKKVVGLWKRPARPYQPPSERNAQIAFTLLYELHRVLPSVRNGMLEALRARATPTDYLTELAWPAAMIYLTPEIIIEVLRPALAKFYRMEAADVVRTRPKPPQPRPRGKSE